MRFFKWFSELITNVFVCLGVITVVKGCCDIDEIFQYLIAVVVCLILSIARAASNHSTDV